MEFNEVVKNRRSIRKYDTDKKVTREQVEELIRYAIYAPTWKNSQTARYYCALDGKGREAVANCLQGTNKDKTEGAALIVAPLLKIAQDLTEREIPTTNAATAGDIMTLASQLKTLYSKHKKWDSVL